MTLGEARILLGDNGKVKTDEQLLKVIETASLLKDLFFDHLLKGKLYKKIAK